MRTSNPRSVHGRLRAQIDFIYRVNHEIGGVRLRLWESVTGGSHKPGSNIANKLPRCSHVQPLICLAHPSAGSFLIAENG